MATIKDDKQYGPTVYGKISLRIPAYDLNRISAYIEQLLRCQGYKPQDNVRRLIRLTKYQSEGSNKSRLISREDWFIKTGWVKPEKTKSPYPRFHLILLNVKIFYANRPRVVIDFTIHVDQVVHVKANYFRKDHPPFKEAQKLEAVHPPKNDQQP